MYAHDAEKIIDEQVGRKVESAEILPGDPDELVIKFADGGALRIWDGGQSCCEHRYMSTDDDLGCLSGHRLLAIEGKAGPPEENLDYGEYHETCFVEIITTGGLVTLVNHNSHNGYYGGFSITAVEVND